MATVCCVSALAQERPPMKEHVFTFKGAPAHEGWKLVGKAAEESVRFEETGMRITLKPPQHHGNTGFATGLRIQGDFEITTSYEILKEAPEPGDPSQTATRIALFAKLDGKMNLAGSARKITDRRGPQFIAWVRLWDEGKGKHAAKVKEVPAGEKKGRLRLVRKGAEIASYVSEGANAEFELIREFPFTKEDIKDVEIIANTGGPRGELDVRVTDLRIRASAPAQPPPDLPAAPDRADGRRIWLILLGILAALAALLVLLGVFWRRRGAASAAKEPEAMHERQPFVCSGCGRTLKVKPELVGKKVKCAQCGATSSVPASDTADVRSP
jgi:hypothetical protein